MFNIIPLCTLTAEYNAVYSGLDLTNSHTYLKNKEKEIVSIILVLEAELQKFSS